ncbi:MAG TPA: cytochrome c3 family protein [Blastocatellia bacterium]|nr:cytochrome c3 family protein [Blastocatellia bacterium]
MKLTNDPPSYSRSRLTFFALIPMIALVLFQTAAAQKKDSCVECHSRLEGPLSEPVRLSKGDVHNARGLSCVDCHRGDASRDDKAAAKGRQTGYIGKPRSSDIPRLCGQCHSNAEFMKKFNPSLRVDQESEYSTSIHGRLLKSGDQKVATCVSCHGNHGVRAVKDPLAKVYALNVAETCGSCHANAGYMNSYRIPHDQFDNYKKSVHARALYERQDLSAPTCNDCHGNHGAAPPGLASVANVCGQCHSRQASLFQASVHKTVFGLMEAGECVQCHSNHGITPPSDEMLGVGEKSACTNCHGKGDSGYAAAEEMLEKINQMSASISRSTEILNRAERAGMEVSKPRFELNDAKDALTQSRVLVHTFSTDELDKVIKPGMDVANKSYGAGASALDELSFRRKGLAGSLFFILFLAALIYLKVRELERRSQAEKPAGG